MKGRRSSISTLPDNLSFDHCSASDDPLDSSMPWNSMHASTQNILPDYGPSSAEMSIPYPCPVRHNANWSLGESSSSSAQNQVDQNETKTDHSWNFPSQSTLTFGEPHYEPTELHSVDNVVVNSNDINTIDRMLVLQRSSSVALPQDLNLSFGFGDRDDDDNDDDCQIVERPNPFISSGTSNEPSQVTGSTANSFGIASGFMVEQNEERPVCSLEGRRSSRKRKALELHVGQSSRSGSSNGYQNPERNQWHDIPAAGNFNMSTETENEFVINNGSQQLNPGLRLGIGGSASATPLSFTALSESSRRNFRLRFNSLHQQNVAPSNPFPAETDTGSTDVTYPRHSSRLVLRNRLLELNPPPSMENSGPQEPRVLNVPSVRRNHHSRWSRASSSRAGSSSSGERDAPFLEERNISRSISEHPMFVPASNVGSSSQNTTNWNLWGVNNNGGSIGPSSRVGSSSGVNSSASNWPHRQYPRRLSEIIHRSLLSGAGTESGGLSSNQVLRMGSSAPFLETLPSSGGSVRNAHRTPSSRLALLERHLDGVFGTPHSLRTLSAAREGRSSVMSEIRHVLDLMRRGEGLRVEDMMILDHSVLFGMADIQDRHQDMRLDVDNMSYEELLALGERIGNVCTGLTEETIMSRLKQGKYVDQKTLAEGEAEPCSICREEYTDGEDLGTLECRHDFHLDCIKQWLMQKNLCPICKTTGLTTT